MNDITIWQSNEEVMIEFTQLSGHHHYQQHLDIVSKHYQSRLLGGETRTLTCMSWHTSSPSSASHKSGNLPVGVFIAGLNFSCPHQGKRHLHLSHRSGTIIILWFVPWYFRMEALRLLRIPGGGNFPDIATNQHLATSQLPSLMMTALRMSRPPNSTASTTMCYQLHKCFIMNISRKGHLGNHHIIKDQFRTMKLATGDSVIV